MDRVIAVNSNCYHGFTVQEALRGVAAAGFRWVELTATKGWTEHVMAHQSFEQLLAVKTLMEGLGIRVIGMSGHCNLMDSARLVDFEKNMELAAFFGSPFIVSSIGEAHLEDRQTRGVAGVVENIKSLIPGLERLGLTLVLETHGDHSTARSLLEIVRGVDSPLVKINYDTANVVFYGGVVPQEDILLCLDQVAYIHVKDKAGETKEWNFPALGEGEIDFPTIFKLMEDSGNEAPFSVEIEFTQDGPESIEEVHRAVKASADYLVRHGFTL